MRAACREVGGGGGGGEGGEGDKGREGREERSRWTAQFTTIYKVAKRACCIKFNLNFNLIFPSRTLLTGGSRHSSVVTFAATAASGKRHTTAGSPSAAPTATLAALGLVRRSPAMARP